MFSNTVVFILAGGFSKRAEKTKGLRIISGEYWLEIIIKTFTKLGIKYIFIGLGFEADKYITSIPLLKSSLNKIILKENTSIVTFINNNPENGMFSTIHNGLNMINQFDFENLFIFPIDNALPNEETLINLLSHKKYKVVKPCFNGKKGHPILINKEFCIFLSNLKLEAENYRLDNEINKLNEHEIYILNTNDSNILVNMNTKEEWDNYCMLSKQ